MHSNSSNWGFIFLNSSSRRWPNNLTHWKAYPAGVPRYRNAPKQVVVRFFDFYSDHPKARRLHANTHRGQA